MISDKFTRFSVIPLIVANALPLIGVLFFDWNLLQILFLYWFESGIVGFYSIFKLIKISGIFSIFLVPFFIIHYGGFMTGHLFFIFVLFAPHLIYSSFFPSSEIIISLLNIIKFSVVVLIVSHGISFFFNFIGNREYQLTNIGKQMQAPYRRIIIMHLTLLFSGWLILLFKEPIFGLVLLIVIKTIADLNSHLKEHDVFEGRSVKNMTDTYNQLNSEEERVIVQN